MAEQTTKSVIVGAPAAEAFAAWANFENFPQFMSNVEQVRVLGGNDRMSHWKLKGPLGTSAEFDASRTAEVANASRSSVL